MKEEEYEIGEISWDLKSDLKNGLKKKENNEFVNLSKKDIRILEETIYSGGLISIYFPLYVPNKHYEKIKFEIDTISYIDVLNQIREFYSEDDNYNKLGEYVLDDYLEDNDREFKLHVKKPEEKAPTLFKRQKNHLKRILNIVKTADVYIDTSPVGAGKTYVTCALAKKLGLKLVLISPLALLKKWKEIARSFGVEVIKALTYDSLRGTVKSPPTNGLVKLVNGEYLITKSYENLIRAGILLVFDEVHKLKNMSAQTNAALALIRGIVNVNKDEATITRVGLIGATPADKKIHARALVRLLGLTTRKDLYKLSGNRIMPTGLNDIVEWGLVRDPVKTNLIFDMEYTSSNIKEMVFEFVTKVAIPLLGSAMPSPPTGYYYNGLFILNERDKKLLKEAVNELNKSLKFRNVNSDEEKIEIKTGFGNITPSLEKIEAVKIPTLVRVIKEDLEEDPNRKIIAYCNYNNNIDKLVKELAKYKPLEYHGRIKIQQRNINLELFQADNNDYRVLIGNAKCGGVGIDLDDKFGNHPRIMYIMPSYECLELYQSAGRVNRLDSKSKSIVFFFYGNDEGAVEKRILDALARKSEYASNYTLAKEIPPFPGDYETYIELPR